MEFQSPTFVNQQTKPEQMWPCQKWYQGNQNGQKNVNTEANNVSSEQLTVTEIRNGLTWGLML